MIEAIMWLVINLYHEARAEPVQAQVAVVHVCLYRADWRPENVPSVLLQRNQFSWVSDSRKIEEAKEIILSGKMPDRMKKLVNVVYKALATPHYARPELTNYQVPGASSTWTCWPGGVSTVTFPGSGHIFCSKKDVVKPGNTPKYIIKRAAREKWRVSKKEENSGC